MRKLWMMLAVLLALVLSLTGVLAQEAQVPCGDLSDEDCEILEQSQQAMNALSAASVNLDVTVNIEDAGQVQTLSLTGQGAFTGAGDLPTMNDTTQALGDSQQAIDALTQFVDNFDAELSLNLDLPDDIGAGDSMTGTDTPDQLSLELRLVDGVGYINFETLQPLFGQNAQGTGLSGWGGVDLSALLNRLAQQPGLLDQLGQTGTDMTTLQPEALTGFSDPEFINEYLIIERGADEDGAAVFNISVDFDVLVESEAFRETIRQQVEAQGETLTDEELDQAIQATRQSLSALDFSATQVIDTETYYTRRVGFDLDFDVADLDDQGQGAFSVSGEFTYDDYGDVTVTAPENASIVQTDAVFGLLGGMMPGMTPEFTPEAPAATPENTPES